MGLKLITESNFNITLNEDKNKVLFIEGIFASCEKKNQNGRIYSKSLMEREINKIMNSVQDKTALGEIGHPEGRAETSLEKAAILIEDLSWKKNDVIGKAKLLSTPYGQIAKSLINDGVKYGISTRGLGTVNEETNYVNEDYQLITWDLVSNPSGVGCWVNGIYEGKEFDLPSIDKKPTNEEVQNVLKEHEKRIWQVLENISKSL